LPPLSPEAQVLAELLGDETKARRLDACGDKYCFVRHDEHPVQRQNISQCKLRCCVGCGDIQAMKQFSRYRLMETLVTDHFTHLEIFHEFSLEHSTRNIKHIHHVIRTMLPDCVFAKTVPRRGQLVTKVIYARVLTNALRINILQAIHAKVEVRMLVAIRHKADFAKVLEHVTLSELPKDDHRLRAEYEFILRGCHQYVVTLPSKLVNRECPLTILVVEPDPNDPTKTIKTRRPRCKKCGHAVNYHTQTFCGAFSLERLSKQYWVPY
jgi:hypothetical protein